MKSILKMTGLGRAMIFAALLLLSFGSFAQQPMLKTIRADRPSMMFGSVIAEGNSFVVSGVTSSPTGPNYARSVIGRLDNQGNFMSVKYIYDNVAKSYGTFFNSLGNHDNRYTVTGYTEDSIPRVLLITTDQNFSPHISEYGNANIFSYTGHYYLETGGNGYIAGLKTISGKSNISLIKVDLFSNMLWERIYGTLPNAENATSLIKLSNGNLMIGSFRRDFETPIETSNTWLLEVDTAGEIVRQWFDDNDSTLGAYGLRQTSDGGFIYGAQNIYYQSINGPSFIGSIVKLDSNFNVQWRWTGGYPRDLTGIYDIEELPDGSFVGCGNSTYLNGTVMIGAWVVKLSASGQLIWNRYYSAFNSADSENYLNDIDLLPNGNLVAVGETRDFTDVNRGQMGLLMVLDSNGCVIENCMVGIDDIEPKVELSIYPNPTNDLITVSINNASLHNAKLTITNTLGQALQQIDVASFSNSLTLDMSSYANGLYFLSIAWEGGRISRQVVKE